MTTTKTTLLALAAAGSTLTAGLALSGCPTPEVAQRPCVPRGGTT